MNNKNPFFYLHIDWVNNFLTVAHFAEYYGISEELAQMVIDQGREVLWMQHDSNRNKIKVTQG